MGGMVRRSVVFLVVAVTMAVAGSRASTHEANLIGDGQYEVIVGFLDEPAFVGEKNALQLSVAKLASVATPEPGDATPVADDEVFDRPIAGLESTLRAEVRYGDERLALTLEPVANAPGEYVSYFFPMAEGAYGFRLFGKIERMAIDETFTSSPDGFSSVRPRIEFPMAAAASKADSPSQPVAPATLMVAGLAIGAVAYTRRRQRA